MVGVVKGSSTDDDNIEEIDESDLATQALEVIFCHLLPPVPPTIYRHDYVSWL